MILSFLIGLGAGGIGILLGESLSRFLERFEVAK